MLPLFNNGSDEMTSATSMDISESFRPEDLSKTDFFDFVTAPPEQEQESNQGTQSGNNVNSNSNNDQQPLQGFDQVSLFVQFILYSQPKKCIIKVVYSLMPLNRRSFFRMKRLNCGVINFVN